MTRRSLLLLLLIGLLITSCGPSNPGQGTPDIDGTIAANAQTMVVALFQTQTALAPAATNTALPTATPLPSSTALTTLLSSPTVYVAQPVYVVPTATGPTPTPLASSLGVGCNNLRVVNSYTDPEGPYTEGQTFTQYWKVENNGTCNWVFVYSWVFASGDKMGEATSARLGKIIEPGKWTTLSVGMRAPNKSGTFKSSWRMSDGGGKVFGEVLLVSIKVGGPTNTPQPDTAATAVAQTVAAGVQQTIAAQTASAAAQNAINTAVAATLTQAAHNAAATAICLQTPATAPQPGDPPCQ